MGDSPGRVRCTFFGTTSLYFTDGETGIFIDAFLSRPALYNVGLFRISPDVDLINEVLEKAQVKHLDAIFVAHSHHDHVMDAPQVISCLGGIMYGSESTLNVGRGAGLGEDKMHLIREGDEYIFGRFRVQIFEGEHSPGNKFPGTIDAPLTSPTYASSYRDGGCFSFHLTHPDGSILIHPSANYVQGKFHDLKADAFYLGIGVLGSQTATFQEQYWAETVAMVQPKLVIPIHWDNFFQPLSKPLQPLPWLLDKYPAAKQFIEKKQAEQGWAVKWQEAFETIYPLDV